MIARAEAPLHAPRHVMGVDKFERFFRTAAGLDVDKQDLKRYSDFINRKIYDLLLRAEAAASANGRDIIQPYDLPITKGLQESMHAFKLIDAQLQVKPLIDRLTARPPLDRALSDEADQALPQVAGGVSFALARAFKIIDPDVKNPQSVHWERCFRIFDLLV
jgi:hypothetical protein